MNNSDYIDESAENYDDKRVMMGMRVKMTMMKTRMTENQRMILILSHTSYLTSQNLGLTSRDTQGYDFDRQ